MLTALDNILSLNFSNVHDATQFAGSSEDHPHVDESGMLPE
jgi:hypothetical protein